MQQEKAGWHLQVQWNSSYLSIQKHTLGWAPRVRLLSLRGMGCLPPWHCWLNLLSVWYKARPKLNPQTDHSFKFFFFLEKIVRRHREDKTITSSWIRWSPVAPCLKGLGPQGWGYLAGMVVPTFNSNTGEADRQVDLHEWVQGRPGLHKEFQARHLAPAAQSQRASLLMSKMELSVVLRVIMEGLHPRVLLVVLMLTSRACWSWRPNDC